MIHGIGTDIVAVGRLERLFRRHGERALERLLAPTECDELAASGIVDPPRIGRFLAKRFAAKEAFAKAMGTGVRAPFLLTAIAVTHDPLGKPAISLAGEAATVLSAQGLVTHLSLSDEGELVLAFVVVEKRT